MLARIDRSFRHEAKGQLSYAQEVVGGKASGAAFVWPAGVELSALNAAAAVEPRYLARATAYAKSLDAYWFESGGLGGYNASIHPGSADRYYDDNAWLVIDFVDLYELGRDPEMLRRARRAMTFVLSGEDAKLGGGIYWHEQERNGKNTCSNAPSAVAAMRLYEATGEKGYLEAGVRLYAWVTSNLEDGDGLFFDNVSADGKVNKGKLTYNTALPIRAACQLYDATHEGRYLREAEKMAAGGVARWCGEDGRMRDPGCFAHLFAEALLELSARDGEERWASAAGRAVAWEREHGRDAAGWYAGHWGEAPKAAAGKVELIDQASAARAYWRMAMWEARGRK